MFDIRIWSTEGALASAITTPIDILVAANLLNARRQIGSKPVFSWSIESVDGAPIRTASRQIMAVDGKISARGSCAAVYVASPFLETWPGRPGDRATLVDALQRAHRNGALVATHCTGAFLFAEAGLLRHRRATTHWARARELALAFPDIRLSIRDVVTEDGGVICGGTVTSYSNVMLTIIARLAGEELAADVARYLLIDRNRGPQTAYAKKELEQAARSNDAFVLQASNWIKANYWRPFKLADLALSLGVSERTFNRRFTLATGMSPIKFIQAIRIESAKRLLEEGQNSAQDVSTRVGYEDLATFRELFKRETGMTLKAYQSQFATAAAPQP